MSKVKDAILKYSEKQMPKKKSVRKKKNEKPEQKVAKECMEWFKNFGFSMSIVESRAVYSLSAGQYLRGQTVVGFPDSVGCTPFGIGCFVEFKSRGRLSTLRDAQREFLREKILKGCFACVVDSPMLLQEHYSKWKFNKQKGNEFAVGYLLNSLPKEKKKREPIEEEGDELPF